MSLKFNRRSMMRGLLGGAGVVVGVPTLDAFLNVNGNAYADGAALPTRFGTYFWGLGLTDTGQMKSRWVPETIGANYDVPAELESIAPIRDKVSVFSGFRVIGDGKPNIVHWSGHAAILAGQAPDRAGGFAGASLDTMIADQIGRATRFKAIDMDASGARRPVNYSTRTGRTFSTPESSPIALYTRLFGQGFQDPNSPDWAPDPTIMLRQSVLSSITDQRQALMSNVGRSDQVKLEQYFTSIREMENSLEVQLQRPPPAEACVVPTSPEEVAPTASVDVVNSNTNLMARLLAMGLACNQTKVFNFVHTGATSETYMPGRTKIYHQITHDEPTDATMGYQKDTSELAAEVMKGYGDFLQQLDAIPEGDGTLLDNSLVFAFSDTGYAKIHSIENIPMLLAGGAGGRHKAGQHVHSQGDPVTRVSLTAMQLAGAAAGEFGVGSMRASNPISEVMA